MIAARILTIATVAFAVIFLFTVRVTMPVLSLIGLIACAIPASIAALVYRRRSDF